MSIIGLEKFAKYFSKYKDEYIVIGGMACYLLLNDQDLDFRATKDIDVVITVLVETSNFIIDFKKFIKDGEYTPYQMKDKKNVFYRFISKKNDFPQIIELFLGVNKNEFKFQHVKPLSNKIESLSTIILDEKYIDLLIKNTVIIRKIRISNPLVTIILKLKAWSDLNKLKESGEEIQSNNITKHQRDIFRLWQLLTKEDEIFVSKEIYNEILSIIENIKDKDINLGFLRADYKTSSKDILNEIKNKIKTNKM